jgi:type II secretory pathway pseudopilin PulG
MYPIKLQFLIMKGRIRNKSVQGFTMVEVIVGILLILIFTAISMQAIVMATAVKVHGDDITDATALIQEDLEDITTIASAKIDYSSNKYTINPASTECASPTATTGYASILLAKTSINGGTISSTTPIAKTNSTGQRSYRLVRTATAKNSAPYNVVQISYQVYRGTTATATNAIFSTPYLAEVIPGASFYCR